MTTIVSWIRRHGVICYFLIALAFSWAIWIPMAVTGARVHQGSAWPTHIPGLFGPLVAAFAMSVLLSGRVGVSDLLRRMFQWRLRLRWYLTAFSPLGFFVLAALLMAASGHGWPDLIALGRFSGLPVVSAPIMWLLLLVAAYGEEVGWRGFAVARLLMTKGLLTTGLVVGVFWALWHLPLMFVIENYRELGLTLIPGFVLGLLAGSVFLAWLYRATGGSVLMVAIWHATYDLVSGTAVAHGLVAATVSVAVMLWATLIVICEIRKRVWVSRKPVLSANR